MEKRQIKAVSLDWEGCCSEPGGGQVPWPRKKLVKLADLLWVLYKESGICFFINSGRQAPYIEAALQNLGIVTNLPSICENGSLLYFPLTKNFKINPAITPEKLKNFQKVKEKLYEFAAKSGAGRELGKEFSVSLNPSKGIAITELYCQVIEEAKEYIDIIEITHSQSAADVTIRGVNKESGLQFWSQKTGINFIETAGIGDSKGDWPVLEKVELPLCPVNATPETQKLVSSRGGYVSPYPTTQGTIDCVGQITDHPRIKSLVNRFVEEISIAHETDLKIF